MLDYKLTHLLLEFMIYATSIQTQMYIYKRGVAYHWTPNRYRLQGLWKCQGFFSINTLAIILPFRRHSLSLLFNVQVQLYSCGIVHNLP